MKTVKQKEEESAGLWKKPQAAVYLGISIRTLELKMRQRKVPYIKNGGSVRFDKDVLRDFMKRACRLGG